MNWQNLSRQNLYPIILILIFFVIQSAFYNDKRVTVDEVWHSVTAYNVLNNNGFYVTAIKEKTGPQKLEHLAVYQSALVLWHQIFPKEIRYSRLLTTAAALILIAVIYFFSLRVLESRTASILAASILAFDNIFFIASNTVRSDAIIPLSLMILIVLIFDPSGQTRKPLQNFIAGIIGAVSIGIHPNFLLVIPALFIILIFQKDQKAGKLKRFLPALSFAAGTGVIILFLIISFYFTGRFEHVGVWQYFWDYAITGFRANFKIIALELNRYSDFTQFPFRLHILIVFVGSLIFSFRSKNRMIRIIAQLTSIILIEMIFIKNKNVRYFSLLIPLFAVMTANLFYSLSLQLKARKFIKLSAYLFIFISLAGNAFFIFQNRDKAYDDFRQKFSGISVDGKNVLGPLVLWDVFKKSEFTSLYSQKSEIAKINFDYVIVQEPNVGEDFVSTKGSTYSKPEVMQNIYGDMNRLENLLKKSNTELLREIDATYLGTFRIYKTTEPVKMIF